MRYEELLRLAPPLKSFAETAPPEIDGHFVLRHYESRCVIHQKDSPLEQVGILLSGCFRVINEFENGNIFMIERNEPIAFVGEVTLLAEADKTSVTIETVTPCQIVFLPAADFDLWLRQDGGFLRAVSMQVAKKLYCSSYNRGERLFYSSSYLLLKYIIGAVDAARWQEGHPYVLQKTRGLISEELGMTLKTLNRTVNCLRDDGAISLHRGKIALSREQYETGKKQLFHYLRQSKNGAPGR